MSWRRSLVTTASLLAVIAAAPPALADEKAVCVAASEQAQQLRSTGKLVEAREQLSVCGRPECPKLIQQDCTQWMTEVLGSMPSVVPAAKDRQGRDIVDVRLTVDGRVTTDTLDGKPIVLDPGVHAFHFETKGAPPLDEQVVVRPGEKNRILTVTFAIPVATTGPRDENGASTTRDGGSSSPPVLAYVLGGIGIAVLAVALVVDLGANSDAHDLRDSCAPKCAQSDVDDVQKKYTIAGITAGIGGALLVTGVVLFIVHGRGTSSVTKTGASASFVAFDSVRGGTTPLFRF